MRIPRVIAVIASLTIAVSTPAISAQGSGAIQIVISPTKPTDLPPLNGRSHHTLTEAGIFAWQQFIAHTWPAKAQTGEKGTRDEPDTSMRYGQKGSTGQVVWETYRHKAELNPGFGEPNGYTASPSEDFGYDSLPKYIYRNSRSADQADWGKPIMPVTGQTSTVPPFDNLDEVNEIVLCNMSAGVSGGRVLYQAKVNRVVYKYNSEHLLFKGDIGSPGEMRANAAFNLHVTDANQIKKPYIDLPVSNPSSNAVGSIEIKSAWRKLASNEDKSKFYTNRVRFYLKEGEETRYKEEEWALIALHIIHKTPLSPVFIYTSFSHIDNIRAGDGTIVEEPDGTVKSEYKFIPPFAPELRITKSDLTRGQEVSIVPNTPGMQPGSKQLFFKNLVPFTHGITVPVAVQRRLYEISSEIRAVNRAAQGAIRAYDQKAVWQFYKLVNVQAATLPSFVDRSESDALSLDDQASFFMANEVVETNVPLQQFSGTLSPGDTDPRGPFKNAGNYDYALFDDPGIYKSGEPINSEKIKGKPIYNVYLHPGAQQGEVWRKLNMGGCVGCHGPQGQLVGGDFSVLVARGKVSDPEAMNEDVTFSNRLLEYVNYKTNATLKK